MSRWKPTKGERYFFVGDNGFVNFTYWENDKVDHDYYKFGNCFHTEKEAEKAFEIVKELLVSLHGEKTLFTEITKSPEVLAEKLVYCEEPERFCENASWCSVLLGKVSYAKKDEAIAATVAKLNEVVDYE